MLFKLGDRVVYSEVAYRVQPGWEGTVIKSYDETVEVSWDKLTTGHSCSGCCKMGTGWNVHRNSVKLIKAYDLSPADLKYKKIITKIKQLDERFKVRHEKVKKVKDDDYAIAA